MYLAIRTKQLCKSIGHCTAYLGTFVIWMDISIFLDAFYEVCYPMTILVMSPLSIASAYVNYVMHYQARVVCIDTDDQCNFVLCCVPD